MVNKEEDIVPRLELRAFASHFGKVVDEIRQRSVCTGIVETGDIYLLTAATETHNVKIRNNQLDIKTLMGIEQGLERWRPQLKLNFPASTQSIQSEILPALDISASSLPAGEMTKEAFLQDVAWSHPEIRPAQVFKRRFFFTIDQCQVEIAELMVNGAAIQTVAVEHEEATAVLDVKVKLGLTPYENVNYLLALKRILGMAPLPAPTWQMQEGETDG